MNKHLLCLISCIAFALYAQVGSPEAKQSLSSSYLPVLPKPFRGIIDFNARSSRPFWQPTIVPKKDAPNILLIITDDVGFGAPSTFGGSIPTPTLERVAQMGLRYTQFHSTALCSPTRASLITGRNHHSVHMGVIQELATGYPGYDTIIGKDTATIGEILKQNGYATSWFGKNHNTPDWATSQTGPFDNWPIGYGFEYFYGFLGGDTNQWAANVFRNTSLLDPLDRKKGWNLTTAMADDAIHYLNQLNAIQPERPFFLYYAPGGTHAPHHPTPEWIEKFKGSFKHGWNDERRRIFQRQQKLGVIPPHAQLTPWPSGLPRWETLSAQQKKLYARQAEVYAAYLAYTDYEIGRVIDAIDRLGKLDNTLIIYISGDNGSSPEGLLNGTPNEIAALNGVVIPTADQMKYFDVWGSDKTYPHMAAGWAWAFDTPFKWTKQIASHFGGTRQGMAIAWPKKIKDTGTIRTQFHHVIDIAPTILDAAGIPVPRLVNGVPQKPVDGVSMVYSWNKKDAPTTRTTQYFEMLGNRALIHNDWMASTTPILEPWALKAESAVTDVMNGYTWELYNIKKDPTQNTDLAKVYPQRLAYMKNLFIKEGTKNNVFPLDNSTIKRLISPRPSATEGRSVFTYTSPLTGIPHGSAPSLLNRSYSVTVQITVPKDGSGMLVTHGGRFGGYGFYILKGVPVFIWNYLNMERTRWAGRKALTPGEHILTFDFIYNGPGFGKGGIGTLTVDGNLVDRKEMKRTIPFTVQWDETFDIGSDTGTPVSEEYAPPFTFTGTINQITIKLKEPQLTKEEQVLAAFKGHRNNQASE